MNLVSVWLGILLLICGWGFLLAAAVAFPSTDNPIIGVVPWPFLCLDLVLSAGVLSMAFVILRSWRKVPAMRTYAGVGAGCLVAGVAIFAAALRT